MNLRNFDSTNSLIYCDSKNGIEKSFKDINEYLNDVLDFFKFASDNEELKKFFNMLYEFIELNLYTNNDNILINFFYLNNVVDILKFVTVYLYEIGKEESKTILEFLNEFKNKIFEITGSDKYSEYFIEKFSDFINSKINSINHETRSDLIDSRKQQILELIDFINVSRRETFNPEFKRLLSDLSEFIQEKSNTDELIIQALLHINIPEIIKISIRNISFSIPKNISENIDRNFFHKEFIKNLKIYYDIKIQYIANEFLVWCNSKKGLNISYKETELLDNMPEELNALTSSSESLTENEINNEINFETELIINFIDKINSRNQDEITYPESQNHNDHQESKKNSDEVNRSDSQNFNIDIDII